MSVYITCTADCPVPCDGRCRTAQPPPDLEAGPSHLERLRAALVDTAGLDDIPDPAPLIRGVLQADSLAWLVGRPGHGKSLVALDMAAAVGTGQAWQTYPVTGGAVLYVVAESVSDVRQRVRAWEAAAGEKMTGVQFLTTAVQSTNAAAWGALCELVDELRAALVVLDTQARVTVGLEENSARDMGVFVQRLDELRRASGACVLVLHHTPRNGDHMRGSTAMEGAATTIIRAVKEGTTVTLTNDPDEGGKQKDGPPFDPVYLRLVERENSVVLTATDRPQTTDLSGKAVRAMLAAWWQSFGSDPVSVSVLVKAAVCAERTFHRSRKALVNAGVVAQDGKGNQVRYHLIQEPTP